jgi:dihydroorotase
VSEASGIRPLHLAREAADTVKLPIMVHPQEAWCDSIDEILAVMKERDILTHCFHGHAIGILDADGVVRRSVREAANRGVLFDVGHGRGSFKWDIVERALQQKFQPQTISSDLHIYNLHGPVYDLATTVNKFLHLGLPLDDVIAKVTAVPAQVLGMSNQLGTLKVGAWGDAVVFAEEEGNFELIDSHGQKRMGRRRLMPKIIVKAGKIYGEGRERN